MAAAAQVLAEHAGHGGQHDVVHGAAELVLDRLDVGEVRAHPGVAAVRADRLVVGRGRGGVEPGPGHGADSHCGVAQTLDHASRTAEDRADRPRQLARDRRALHQRLAQQLHGGGERTREPALAGVGGRGGVGGGIEEHGHDVHAGDAVHERVMGLRQHREAIALEALNEPDLPERLVAVELLREHAAGEVPSCFSDPGAGSAVERTW